MLRWGILAIFAAAIAVTAPASAADTLVTPHARKSARAKLPPGLPRAHYDYRTTLTYDAPAPPAQVYVVRDPDVLFTPVGVVPYAPRVYGVPILPGSITLPGYYGTSHSYSYDGPYYGGPYTPYWSRLPYAGGVFGYR